ncbi:MAG: TlpA family protein disulfide reductase [Sulfuricella sp.]|nr:TlpA family protein disulfide reductase [Sulfuricella sp.]
MWINILLAALLASTSAQAASPSLTDAQAIPHVGEAARETYVGGFLQADLHRAFAIAPGGAWGWAAEQVSADTALAVALDACGKHSEIPCVPYAVDEQRVFDAVSWATLWGPYKNRSQAAQAPTGKKRGMRFPDLAFADANGKPFKLAALRGKAVVVHFWGSWCNPCKRELPDLQKLVAQLKGSQDIAFILLPVRESTAAARRWLAAQQLDLPLYDSGLKGSEDEYLKLAGGGKIRDRDIAMVFPTTYVLDKHGMVVFSHAGPLENWLQYAPFLHDVVGKSGK